MGKPNERSSALLHSTGEFWIEFLQAESAGICCVVCAGLRKIAEEDRVWKKFCHSRWRRVNVEVVPNSSGGGIGGHRTAYASLNGWRDPAGRLGRTILSTAASDVATGQRITRASQAAAPGSAHAKNISGMDVASSRVVVCSADYAWYYDVQQQSSSHSTSERRDDPEQNGTHQQRSRWARMPADIRRYDHDGGSSIGSTGKDGDDVVESFLASSEEAEAEAAMGAAAPPPPKTVGGFQLPSSCVTEARFSGDGERCFFGTMSGHIYVHECGDGAGGSGSRTPEAIVQWTPNVALESPGGSSVAVRQVVASFEGGCTKGSRLGVLCRPPSGWQANLEGSSEGGYLFLADTNAQAVVRRMKLGGGLLGGMEFPTMERGGAAVSTAPLSSSGFSSGSSGGSSGELFAVGFSGGTVALFDARCQEGGGMVGGFLTMHRWLERVRGAGALLMASYGRNKNIETWDIRKLPPFCPTRSQRESPAVPAHRPLRRLDDLGCRANSPDFWVEPHGLCVAVHGAPRHSQSFGAKHVFWPWPNAGAGTWNNSSTPPPPARGESVGGAGGGDSAASYGGDAPMFSVGRRDAPRRRGEGGRGEAGGGGGAGGGGVRAGCELLVPGVVSDSDYRLRLSTGIKFTDTHMATVLDSTRVLVDEMMVVAAAPRGGERYGGCAGAGVTTPVLLAAS